MLIIGIDPGITGSICFFQDGKIIDVVEIPNIPEVNKNKKQLNKNRIDFIKSQYPEMYDEEEGLVDLPANLQALYDDNKLYTNEAQDVLMNMTSGEMDFPEYMATVKG